MADPREIDRCVEGAAGAHQRLLASLDIALDDAATADSLARRPSRLPGWTVGHVLTHLARNADSHRGLFEAATLGEVGRQYPGGTEQRSKEIDDGAGRTLDVLVDDVRRSTWSLEQAWATASAEAWAGSGRTEPGMVAIADLPFRRWREVEVHHVDLDLDLTFDDWSTEYVRRELVRRSMAWRARTPMGLSDLPEAAMHLSPARRLAWLLGRESVLGLPAIEDW